jgi:hypothetical protein
MARQLVLVHGRSQQHQDADALKRHWISAFREGLAKSGLELPISEQDIRFPYYGQTLYDLVTEVPTEDVADVVTRDIGRDEARQEFLYSVLDEVRRKEGITDEQLDQAAERAVAPRGLLNSPWLQTFLEAIDQYVPGASGASIALATNDVYQYLKNPGIRDTIEQGVSAAIAPGVPTVVVGHSLGTVVCYNLLRRDGAAQGWGVPLYVSLGSPLAVTAIKKALHPVEHPPCVAEWYNAMDERDVVALYPLDEDHFKVDPAIENKTDVDNETDNRHGISGYLGDKDVARRIFDALVAS